MAISYPVTLTDSQKDIIEEAIPVRREGSVTIYLPINFKNQTAVFIEFQTHEGLDPDGECPKPPPLADAGWANAVLFLNDFNSLGKVLAKPMVFEYLKADHELAPDTTKKIPVRILVPATNFVKMTAKGSAGDVGAEIGEPIIVLGHGVQ